jgi:hypothetical protein
MQHAERDHDPHHSGDDIWARVGILAVAGWALLHGGLWRDGRPSSQLRARPWRRP